MMVAKIQKLSDNAIIPTKAYPTDAGYDLYAAEGAIIAPGQAGKIPTDVAITPPAGYYGAIVPRSGMATKRGLRPANTPGTCDETYTGNYIVALYNDSELPQEVIAGDRIAQLIFLPYINVEWEQVDSLGETDRGDKGFGSSGGM